jgi:hypothetical protein
MASDEQGFELGLMPRAPKRLIASAWNSGNPIGCAAPKNWSGQKNAQATS